MPKLGELDPRLRAAISKVTGLRPRRVIDHILAHGVVTTEDLARMGYNHAPRAARDVRECGIPLVTTRVTGSDGRSMAAYTFGAPDQVVGGKLAGRQVLPKELRDRLHGLQGGRCATCSHAYEARYLQVDHRVPYEVAGEAASPAETERFMVLCGSCQRKKSWSCEHCANWETKGVAMCESCFWANPLDYSHLAGERVRHLILTFSGAEADAFDKVRAAVGVHAFAAAARRAVLSASAAKR
ncbi:MAG: HNH endonuclease [Myxococcota bacterium]